MNVGTSPVDLTVAGVRIVSASDASRGGEGSHPGTPALPSPLDAPTSLGGGRTLPPLRFVTNPTALARNVGAAVTTAALNAVRSSGQTLFEVRDGTLAVDQVRSLLRGNAALKGVVLLGGYDVVPSLPTDVLAPDLRQILGSRADVDQDSYIVWSDEAYGDVDGDRIGELPVSRIPDARHQKLLLRSLASAPPKSNGRFGIRNHARPFAIGVFNAIAGTQALESSETFLYTHINVDGHLKPRKSERPALTA